MKPTALLLAAAGSLAIVSTTPALAAHKGVSQKQMVHQFVRIFDRLDRDGNGKLSRKALRRLENRGRGHNNGPNARVVFRDDNFRVSFGTGGGRRHGGSSHLGPINSRTFHTYDLNHNGVILRRELRRAVRIQFQRADRNNNGYLSQREKNRSRFFRTVSRGGDARYSPDYRRDRGRPAQGHKDGRRRG